MNNNLIETVTNLNGKEVTRVRTSLILCAAFLVTLIGLYLVIEGVQITDEKTLRIGVLLLLTIAPFMLLYTVVRFLIGGRDSLLGFLLTLFLEHVLKKKMINHDIGKNRR